MAFVTINGLQLLVATGTSTLSNVSIGTGKKRAFDGTLGQMRRGVKREWSLTTAPDTQNNVYALRQMLNDTIPAQQLSGDHWQLDNQATHWDGTNAWSDQGASAITLTNSAAFAQTGGKWSTGGKISLSTATSNAAFTGYSPSTGWIAVFWHMETSTWHAYLVFFSGSALAVYKDGSYLGSSLPTWMTSSYSPNILNFSGTSGDATAAVCDVALYPFCPSSATTVATWAAAFYAVQSAQQWPTGGYLVLGGDLGTANVVAVAASSRVFPCALPNDIFRDNNEVLDFVLKEA